MSSSVSSPQRSILGVERRRFLSSDQRHSVFALLAEDRRSGLSRPLPRFYCFTAVAGSRLFSPTRGWSFPEKHISTSARPPARKQRTREMTVHPAATTTSTGAPGDTRRRVNSPPDKPPPHLRIAEAAGPNAAKGTRKNPCSLRRKRADPSSHIPRQGAQP